jgi:hypothetical protein
MTCLAEMRSRTNGELAAVRLSIGGIDVIRNLLLFAATGAIFATGCQHQCCFNKPDCRPKPYQPSPPTTPINLPPAGLPTTPGPSGSMIPQVGPSNYPPPELNLNPGTPAPSFKPSQELLLPDPLPGGPSSRAVPPSGRGFQSPQNNGKTSSALEPPIVPVVPTAMTGLPGFTRLPDGLASGRKPELDGFASLKQAGYRTLTYLHPAGADVSPIREVASKRGLEIIPIETTPEKLPSALEAFNNAMTSKSLRPVYVCDDDGVRAGAVWYLHFRSIGLNDDAARIKAKPLGSTSQSEEAQAFELAIQKYLANR